MITSQAFQQINMRDQSDAVGKLRISNPQALIDTDFEYGLQGTKWEVLELVNNYTNVGYRPSEPTFSGIAGTQGILSIVGSPNQQGNGGFALNGTMRCTVNTPPAFPFQQLNPISIKFTGISPNTYADSTDCSGVITAVINPSTFEYKANTNTFQGIATNVATEQTLIYTGQWLTEALQPVTRLITFADSCSAAVQIGNSFNFLPGTQFSLIHPISTNSINSPWCGNFSVDGYPGYDLNNNLLNDNTVCFFTASTFAGGINRTIVSSTADGLSCIVNPSGYISHRFLDGGVQLNCGSPYTINNSLCQGTAVLGNIPRETKLIRQTRKYFRYQSGKSIQFSTGITFRPVLPSVYWTQVLSTTVDGQVRYYIPLTFEFDHGLVGYVNPALASNFSRIPFKVPSRIKMSGWQAIASPVSINAAQSAFPLLNGEFDVLNVPSSNVAWIDLGTNSTFGLPPYSTTALGLPVVEPVGWYDATVRTGLFDDLNGMFWEYDGTNINVVRRSSVTNLPGKFNITFRGNSIAGSILSSRLNNALFPGDTINIKGIPYKHGIWNNTSNSNRAFYPRYRGPSITGASARISKVVETRIKQSDFNLDKVDGTGPSGYVLDPGKMQMVFIDYSWYGAGKIRFGLRATNGNIIWVHEILNNNVNTEAHMRTGNLPARFELSTESRPLEILVPTIHQSFQPQAVNNSPQVPTYTLSAYINDSQYLPASGTIFYNFNVENYIKTKSSTEYVELSVVRRFNLGGQKPSTITGGIIINSQVYGGSYNPYDRVYSLNQNCAPTVSHWGTSVIMDGDFNVDKSYLFTAASLSAVIIPPGQEFPLISLRASPSVDSGAAALYGVRNLVNRSQLTLDSVGAAVAGGVGQLTLRLNANMSSSYARTSGWTNVGAGSIAQYWDHSALEATGRIPVQAGDLIGAFFTENTTDTSYNVTTKAIDTTRELGNAILGGNFAHPDGPDTLVLSLRNIGTQQNPITAFGRITWTEAQG